MNNRTWTDQQLIDAVKTSLTRREILLKLGLVPTGSNYPNLNKHIKRLQLDISHLIGAKICKGRKREDVPYKISLENILIENCEIYYSTVALKKRLIKLGLLKNECYICGLTTWLDKYISLQIDHINGKYNDNRLENLRILCPNCHSQTDTYCGKNSKKKHYSSKSKCLDCNKEIGDKSLRCRSCNLARPERLAINWPPIEEIIEMVKNNGVCGTARILKVSHTTIRRHLKKT